MRDVLAVTVVSNAREADDVRELLSPSWAAAAEGTDSELVTVDNQSGADVSSLMTRVLSAPERGGLSANLNLALRDAQDFRWFLVINPDMRLAPGNLRAMVDFMRVHPACGLAACRLVSLGGEKLQHNCRRWQTLGIILARRVPFWPGRDRTSRRYLMLDEAYDREARPDWVSGCYMLLDRALLQDMNGFDAGFTLYFEDCDIARRVQCANREVLFTPSATAEHREHRASLSPFSWSGRTHLASWLRFTRKRLFVYGRAKRGGRS